MRHIATAAALLALSASPTTAEPTAGDGAAEDGYQDGFKALLDAEAREALAAADLDRAWDLFAWLVRLDPDDPRALRELGRIAAAKGEFAQAERALARCMALREGAVDPEVHFIRGEALLALDRRDEAMRELATAEAELEKIEPSRQSRLWRARIYVLRGEAKLAVPVLEPMLPPSPSSDQYQQIALLLAEAYILADRGQDAATLLRELLRFGEDERARDMLAWALTRRHDDGELIVREVVSRRWDGLDTPGLVEYARALERAGRPADALVKYREAAARGNTDIGDDIDRLEARLSPEVMVSGEVGEYPTGNIAGATLGAMVPATRWLRLSAITRHHQLTEGGDQETSSASLWSTFALPSGDELSAGATAWRDAGDRYRAGVSAVALTSPRRWINVYALAGYNQPWLESAATLRESGSTSSVELQLYAQLLSPDLMLVTSGRGRRLALGARDEYLEVDATEYFGAAGLDWIAYADHAQVARGASLQSDMLLPAGFATSLVFSFRHNEVKTSGDLSPRVFLVERSRSDELSVRARYVLDSGGVLALGVNGGIGYDWIREANLWRVGGELLLSLTPMIRVTASSQVATETATGIVGERLIGWVGVNADL